jgi:hypothetical protein
VPITTIASSASSGRADTGVSVDAVSTFVCEKVIIETAEMRTSPTRRFRSNQRLQLGLYAQSTHRWSLSAAHTLVGVGPARVSAQDLAFDE